MKIQQLLETTGTRKYRVYLVRHNDDGHERWDSSYSYKFDAMGWEDAIEIVKARIPSFERKGLLFDRMYDLTNGRIIPID